MRSYVEFAVAAFQYLEVAFILVFSQREPSVYSMFHLGLAAGFLWYSTSLDCEPCRMERREAQVHETKGIVELSEGTSDHVVAGLAHNNDHMILPTFLHRFFPLPVDYQY